MPTPKRPAPSTALHALKVHQWLPAWDEVDYDPQRFRTKPPEHFYLFSLPAGQLRALSGIYRRSTDNATARGRDMGIQRRHDESRSEEIREFVEHGFPWSGLSPQRRTSKDFEDLKKPGWLPTAIVVNMLKPDDGRLGLTLHQKDAMRPTDIDGALASIALPSGFNGAAWKPTGAPPIEVIDGQHRLWAFEDGVADNYELPVVAFLGLDISWQAYLFYTVNIKPKKINASLAFDLYPLLRTEDWLDRFEGHAVYRETRAQELTEALWSYPDSPWYQRIDMLGDRAGRGVTQAAWVRSLLATFVKTFDPKGRTGGLFGAAGGDPPRELGWSRPQQAAFLVDLWTELSVAVGRSTDEWASSLREDESAYESGDPAFSGRYSLLNTDQGVRAVLAVANDLCWLGADNLGLYNESSDSVADGTSERAISQSLALFRRRPVHKFLAAICDALASYDWRTSGFPKLSETVRSSKARFRGSTGYRELRVDLLRHVAVQKNDVGGYAAEALDLLGVS